jgi:hypothetical protein
MKFFVKWLLVAALIPLSGLPAQEAASQSVQFRILTFGKIVGPDTLRLAQKGKQANWPEVKLHLNNFTGPYKSGTRTLLFAAPGADAVGLVPVAKKSLPQSLGTRVLLVFVPRGKPEGQYLVMALPDDSTAFLPGEKRFVNLTPYPVGGQIDQRKFLIKPQSTTALPPKAPVNGQDVYEVLFHFQKEKKWFPLTSTVWPYDPESRSLIFFWWQENTRRIRIQSIAERIEKPDDPKDGGG